MEFVNARADIILDMYDYYMCNLRNRINIYKRNVSIDDDFVIKCPICRDENNIVIASLCTTDEKQECCVCMENIADIVLPCGHSNTCINCLYKLDSSCIKGLIELNRGTSIPTKIFNLAFRIFDTNTEAKLIIYVSDYNIWYIRRGKRYHHFFNYVLPQGKYDEEKLKKFCGKTIKNRRNIIYIRYV